MEEADVVFDEVTDVGDAVEDHREAVEAEAEGEAGGGLGVEEVVATGFVHGGEDGGIDHAAAGDFDPAGVFAFRFEFHVDLKARLREREEVRAEAHGGVRAENLAEEGFERAFEIGEADVVGDVEAFELVEDAEVRGVDLIAAIRGAGGDDADGQCLRGFHRANLHAGGVGAQQAAIGKVEGVLLVAGGVIGGRVQRIEAVELGLDLRSLGQNEAQATQRADGEIADLSEWMQRAISRARTAWERDVDAFDGFGIERGLESKFLRLDAVGNRGAHVVEFGTYFLFLIDGHVTHVLAQRGDAAFFAEEVHANGFERGFILRGGESREGVGFEGVELCEHGKGAFPCLNSGSSASGFRPALKMSL